MPREDDPGYASINPVSNSGPRPMWSVMIPTYNASDYLEQTLRGLLDQAPGPEQMQIAVVDDCSPNGRAREIVARLAPDRVEFHPQPTNVGLSGNWNSAIGKARGRWVHLLHQDDVIFPGFYEKLGRADQECPDAVAAFCRHLYIDGDDLWMRISDLERRTPGILDGWRDRIAQHQLIQCASIVVKRSFYEQHGGYRNDLVYALDWEMWNRIAAAGPVWFEPTVMACWRQHDANESSRLNRSDADLHDVLKAVAMVNGRKPAASEPAGRELRGEFRKRELMFANQAFWRGDRRAGSNFVRRACLIDPQWVGSRDHRGFRRWNFKLWLREKLGRSAPTSIE